MDADVNLSLIPQWEFRAVYPVVEIRENSGPCEKGQRVSWKVHIREDGTLREDFSRREVSFLFWEARCVHILVFLFQF